MRHIQGKTIFILFIGCILAACLVMPGCGSEVSELNVAIPKVTGQKYAVVIGIEQFRELSKIENCDDDASDFRDILVYKAGFSATNIELLLNNMATKTNIKSAIDRVRSRAGPNDLVVFYISSHGGNGPDSYPYDESDGMDESICPYDSRPGTITYDISDDELKSWFDAINCNTKLLIFDTCYSGGMIKAAKCGTNLCQDDNTFEFMEEFTREPDEIPYPVVKDISGSPYLVITAVRATEFSQTGATNSLFSSYFFEGLQKQSADTNRNQWVSAEEAFYYAQPLTESATRGSRCWVGGVLMLCEMHPQIQDPNSGSQVDLVPLGGTKPDIYISSMSVSKDSVRAGDPVSVTFTVKNQGTADAGQFTYEIYLSSDSVITSGDKNLYSATISSGLAAGSSNSNTPVAVTITVSVTIPANQNPGLYYIGVIADSSGVITESNENNNIKYSTISIEGTTPLDFTVRVISCPTGLNRGQAFSLTEETRNTGSGPAGAFYNYYYLSTDTSYSTNDYYLGSRYITSLAAGGANSQAVTLTVPSNVPDGTYNLIMRMDATGAVAESNENNNVWYYQTPIKIPADTTKPDLTVRVISCPTGLNRGQAFSLTEETRNTGSGPAGAFYNYYYLSADTSYSTNDYYLGYRYISSLAAGAANSQAVTLTVPSNVPVVDCYIIIRVDAINAVAESEENNNVGYCKIDSGSSPPVASFTHSLSGNTVTFTDTTTGNPTGWYWNFGDVTSSTLQNPVHTYSPGTYTVTLTASNSAGSSPSSVTFTIPNVQTQCPTTTFSGSLFSGMKKYYSFYIPSGVKSAIFSLDGPSGADFDMYISKGTLPSLIFNDYAAETEAPDEEITITNPASGWYWAMVYAWEGSGSYTVSLKKCS